MISSKTAQVNLHGAGRMLYNCTHFLFHLHLFLASKTMLKTVSSSSSLPSKQPVPSRLALNSFHLELRPVFRTDIHLRIVCKEAYTAQPAPAELLPISPNIRHLSSSFLTLSEGQRRSTQPSKSIREERLSTRNPQLLDHKECSQCLLHAEGRVHSACPNAKCNRKHKQRHACLSGVVVLLKSPDFNKLDKKYDIDEQQLFIYFITAVERSWNVLNANDKYLRY